MSSIRVTIRQGDQQLGAGFDLAEVAYHVTDEDAHAGVILGLDVTDPGPGFSIVGVIEGFYSEQFATLPGHA